MLLFEFVGELFQFEHREPEFDPLFQLPPKSAAFLPNLPLALPALDPSADHLPDFRNQHLCCLKLVSGHCSNREQESQPKPHLSQPSVCGINLRYLIAFSGLKQQVWNTKQALQKHFSGNPVLAWHRLSNRVQISDYSLVLFHYRHLIETLRCLLSWLHCYRRLSPP